MQPRILVPYDFSPAAESALRWAADLHRSVHGGALMVVHLLSTIPIIGSLGDVPIPSPDDRDVVQAQAALREVVSSVAPDASFEVLLVGSVESGVISAAEEWRADLIVMGTHGRGGVKRMVLGSVADFVLRHTSVPVVTMRARIG